MPKIKYLDRKFSAGSLDLIEKANTIIEDYAEQGFDLTLRQLYYQFVSRGFIANKQSEYKRLGDVVNDARLAGLVDWDAIVDRTRNLREQAHWDDPADIVDACAKQFRVDLWSTQDTRVEVWIEKDALVGVLDSVCPDLDVPYFSCRGYTSQSEVWGAAQRLITRKKRSGQRTVILHLGDHDPSGLDMSRDIKDRLDLFTRAHGAAGCFDLRRIALNMDQVQRYHPPPNPAKSTDSRFAGYLNTHGDESWELDALDPATLAALIRGQVEGVLDRDAYDERAAEQARARTQLSQVSDKWVDIVESYCE